MNSQAHPETSYELRFEPLHDQGTALSFPCDANGTVTMDDLPSKVLDNYFLARTVIGRNLRYPVIKVCGATLS
jgi:hypothetical protein